MNFSPLLDTAIGLIFVYFLSSLLCSHICEYIATRFFEYRSKFMELALRNMLSGSTATNTSSTIVDDFFKHSLIQGLVEPDPVNFQPLPGKKPSYIPSQTFALALLDVIAPADGAPNTLTQIRASVANLPDNNTRQALLALIDNANGNLQQAVSNLENWFDGAMDRASGWYKRRTKSILLAIAIVMTLFFNIDSVQVAQSLWRDPTLRAAVSENARAYVEKHTQTATSSEATSAQTIGDDWKELDALNIPIGWSFGLDGGKATFSSSTTSKDVLLKVLGWAITVACISLGAPFWFGLLNQFVNLRRSGPPPK